MTVIRVTSLRGALSSRDRERLGDLMTNAVLEVETGKDTPEARAGVMIQFDEPAEQAWYHAGRAVEGLYDKNAIFWVTGTVMQGPWTDELKSELAARLESALDSVVDLPERRAVWITLGVVPDGAWSVNGRVVRIEQLLWAFEPDRQATIRALLDGA